MIEIINQKEGDRALNIAREIKYKCTCGSMITLKGYFDLDDSGKLIEDIECVECGEIVSNT